MATPILAENDAPAYSSQEATKLGLVQTGYYQDARLFAQGQVIVVGTPQTSTILFVYGYNTFMLVYTFTGVGSTLSVDYLILDPFSQAQLAARAIAAGIAPAANIVHTFGARGQTAVALQGDVFWLMQIRLTAAGANATLSALRLWCGG